MAATVMRRGSDAPVKAWTGSRTLSQFASKMDPQRCQTPVWAVTSVRGPRLNGLSLVLESYSSSHPCPGPTAHRIEPAGQGHPKLIVRNACLSPDAPICSRRPSITRYMFQTRNGCWSLL